MRLKTQKHSKTKHTTKQKQKLIKHSKNYIIQMKQKTLLRHIGVILILSSSTHVLPSPYLSSSSQ